MRLHRFAPLLLGLVAAANLGCVQQPTVHLNHAEISGMQFGSLLPLPGAAPGGPTLLMTIVLDVKNPNSYDVAVRGVRGQVFLGGQYPIPVAFQAPPNGFWMPAGQTTPVRVPLTIPIQLAIVLVQQSLASPTIPYRFSGAADVTGSRTFKVEKDNYAFDENGVVTREQMLAVIPASIFPH